MKKNLNRFAALAMALCLSLSMMSVASAATNEANASGGSATSNVTLSSTDDGTMNGNPAATAMSVTVPTVLPVAVGTDGKVTTATNCTIVNNSYGAVKVSGVTINAAQDWKLADFSTNMANEKVDILLRLLLLLQLLLLLPPLPPLQLPRLHFPPTVVTLA